MRRSATIRTLRVLAGSAALALSFRHPRPTEFLGGCLEESVSCHTPLAGLHACDRLVEVLTTRIQPLLHRDAFPTFSRRLKQGVTSTPAFSNQLEASNPNCGPSSRLASPLLLEGNSQYPTRCSGSCASRTPSDAQLPTARYAAPTEWRCGSDPDDENRQTGVELSPTDTAGHARRDFQCPSRH